MTFRLFQNAYASEYRVRVSCQCIASVYSVRANIRDFKSVSFTPNPSDFDGLETAPSAPSGVNVVRGVSRNVVRDVARGVGRMRQYDYFAGAGSPPLFYISHNLSVEMGCFMDKLLTLTNLSGGRLVLTDVFEKTPHPTCWK